MEVKLFVGDFPFTTEWYRERAHAPHLEQGIHYARMAAVADTAAAAVDNFGFGSIVDLGAGDGGMLTLLAQCGIPSWGYDLMPTNVAYATDVRHVDVRYVDFIDEPIDWGELTVITECLEHLEDPHGMVQRIGQYSQAIIASSPAKETEESHDACHAWAWDVEGYAALIEQGGFQVLEHRVIEGDYDFQVIYGTKS